MVDVVVSGEAGAGTRVARFADLPVRAGQRLDVALPATTGSPTLTAGGGRRIAPDSVSVVE